MAKNEHTLEAIIIVIDRASAPMKKIQKTMSPVAKHFKNMGRASKEFDNILSESMKNSVCSMFPITHKFQDIVTAVSGFGSKVKEKFNAIKEAVFPFIQQFKAIGAAAIDFRDKAIASLAPIAKMVQSTANYGNTIAKTAERVGWNTKSLQEYAYAAKFANMTSEDFHGSLDTMSQNMGKLRAGTGPLVGGFENISTALQQQIKGAKDNEEAFDIMIEAIRAVDDPNKKQELAERFFGNKNMVHLADMSDEELDQKFKEGNDKGLIFSDDDIKNSTKFTNALTGMKASFQGIAMQIGTKLLPVLIPFMDKFSAWLDSPLVRDGIEQVATSFGNMLMKIDFDAVLKGIESFATAVGGMDNLIIGLIGIIKGPLILSFLRLGYTMLTNPIGLIITGIGLLIAAGVALYKNWDTIKSKLSTIWEGIKNFAKELFSNLGSDLAESFSNSWEYFKGVITEKIQSFLDWIDEKLQSLLDLPVIKEVRELFSAIPDINIWNDTGEIQSSSAGTSSPILATSGVINPSAKLTVRFENSPKGITTHAEHNEAVDEMTVITECGRPI